MFEARVSAGISGRYGVSNDQGPAIQNFELLFSKRLSEGNAAGEAERCFSDTRTIAASGTDELDLAGVLADALNRTVTMTAIKAIMVKADPANTNNVVVGGAGSNQVPLFADVSDKIAVKPGGVFMLVDPSAAGIAVTAGTGDKLLIANSSSGTPVTYSILILFEGS